MAPDVKISCPFCASIVAISFEDFQRAARLRCDNCNSSFELADEPAPQRAEQPRQERKAA